jgi:hypothetical protein
MIEMLLKQTTEDPTPLDTTQKAMCALAEEARRSGASRPTPGGAPPEGSAHA